MASRAGAVRPSPGLTSGSRHTDAARERAYGQSHIGRLDKALDEAIARGWPVVDMKTDWTRLPFE
jgi:hypothetical protein